jgi:Holliday junction DNA helicase RuvA
MIAYINGILAQKELTSAVIEAGGVGYHLEISLRTFEALPDLNKPVKLLTHHYVREDAQKLYGFWTQEELETFRHLLTISKIGPKVALSILSKVTPVELAQAVNRQDAVGLKSIPGIGLKTAERLVMELKGKLNPALLGAAGDAAPHSGALHKPGAVREECFLALMALGYTEKQVHAALDRVGTVLAADAALEEWIRKALQAI